jgi:hypothetical protein
LKKPKQEIVLKVPLLSLHFPLHFPLGPLYLELSSLSLLFSPSPLDLEGIEETDGKPLFHRHLRANIFREKTMAKLRPKRAKRKRVPWSGNAVLDLYFNF